MTEAAQETPKKTRNRRPRGQSVPVMKELVELMDKRLAIKNDIRQKEFELAQLNASMRDLSTEIEWRAKVFGLSQQESEPVHHPQFSPQIATPQMLTQPIFAPPPPPPSPRDNINRGMADLSTLS